MCGSLFSFLNIILLLFMFKDDDDEEEEEKRKKERKENKITFIGAEALITSFMGPRDHSQQLLIKAIWFSKLHSYTRRVILVHVMFVLDTDILQTLRRVSNTSKILLTFL